MKKLLLFILSSLLGLVLGFTYGAITDKKKKAFHKCIEQEPSDAVCDSCWKAIYHEPSPF